MVVVAIVVVIVVVIAVVKVVVIVVEAGMENGSNRPTLSAPPPVVPGPRSYRDPIETAPQTSDFAQSHSSVPGTQPKSGQRQTATAGRNQGRGYGRERDPTR
ncbi:hypothetical protein ElyMa_005424100 [Elysia marginata]|uniref:Secreted protein n=1 Tax=Elysia marginata TaxID=1093978 RepID=A0AAV4EIY9_9GAST|nr:hypothetical protein ElyMa_005424100 [Elysia marginata]